MVTHNNHQLLFLSLFLLLSAQFALSISLPLDIDSDSDSDFSSGPAPVPSPSPSAGSSPVPSPSAGSGPSPSPSPSQTLEAADGPDQFDFSDTLAPEANVNPIVKRICDSTDHPALCLATIVPHLDRDSDVPAVVGIAMRTTSDLAKIALTLAKRLANNPKLPPELASILKDCMDSYDTAVENFDSAIDALTKHDVGTMRSQLSAVITNIGDCSDRYKGEDSPFSSVANKLTNMTSNCLAIVSLMKDY